MSIYNFNDHSLIHKISIQRSEGGGLRAYLFTDPQSDPKALEPLKQALVAKDMQWTPTTETGKPALEIRGLGKNETELLHLLRANQVISDAYQRQATIGDKISWWEKIKKNTLQFCGFSYFIGDVGFIRYGWRESFNQEGKLVNPQGLLAGIFYAMGTPFSAFFGQGDKSDFQLKYMSYNLLAEMEKRGIEVPEGAAITAVANGHNEGFWKKIFNFCKRYPAELTNACFGLAGSMLIWSSVRDLLSFGKNAGPDGKTAHSKASVIMDIGLGTLTVLAGLVSIFVEEEAPNPKEPKKTGLARLWQFVKEKPLRTAGLLLGLSTMCHAGSTYKDWVNTKQTLATTSPSSEENVKALKLKESLPGRALFVGTNLTAEILMGVSSKGHGAGVKSDTSLERSVYSVMADMVQRVTPDKRESYIKMLSEYLSNKKHLGGEAANIETGIREQLAGLENNPWVGGNAAFVSQSVQQDKSVIVPATAAPTMPRERSGWGDRTIASQLAAAEPGVMAHA